MGFLGQMAENVANTFTGGLIGQMFGQMNDDRQFRQQDRLMQQQLGYNEDFTKFNNAQQLQMWKDTNYPAQVEQLEKAGLNPGLLYSKGGGGGTTTGSGAATVNAPQAPHGGGENMGMAMSMMQMQNMKAQRELIEAEKNKVIAETPNVPLQGENIKADTASKLQGIENQKAQEILTTQQGRIAKAEADIKSATVEESINIITSQMLKANEEWHTAAANRYVSEQTAQTQVNQANLNLVQTGLENILLKTNNQLGQANIKRISNEIAQGWKSLDIQEQNALTNAKNASASTTQATAAESNANTNMQRLAFDKLIKNMSDSEKATVETVRGFIMQLISKL